ncbi:P-loop containing nucleoside triphosphate hydrolase protein [Mycena alexandri]|uniref:P-loop containing nucleoside triphosphate hydrolase protein n=1 Tax=Mycena alexandri TaxID=1745969 RepID=A0AAD6XB50_9AGAR|nr:P-loop containing nucleoside triphosphate hydrolase protein [Mycena alexandri]
MIFAGPFLPSNSRLEDVNIIHVHPCLSAVIPMLQISTFANRSFLAPRRGPYPSPCDSFGRPNRLSLPSSAQAQLIKEDSEHSGFFAHTAMTSEKTDGEDPVGPPIQSMQLGVYRVVTEIPAPFSPHAQWKRAKMMFPTMTRLVKDVYGISPWMFFFCLVAELWCKSIEPSLSLYLSSRILMIIEDGLKTGSPDGAAISRAVGLRMICLIFTTVVERERDHVESKMSDRLATKLLDYVLRSKLATDLTGVQANVSSAQFSEHTAWFTFKSMLDSTFCMTGALAQLFYISSTPLLSTGHGPAFTLLSLAHPILNILFKRMLWMQAYIVEANDPHFLRMKGLRELSEPKYRQDVITGDVVQHIIREFRRAVKLLGDADMSEPYWQYERTSGAVSHIVTELAGDVPILYYAGNAIMDPAGFSVTAFSTLQQSDSLLSSTFHTILNNVHTMTRRLVSVKAAYDLEEVVHKKSGNLPYPPLGRPREQGMAFELNNVSFSYPGTTAHALNNITLSIKPGQLVVIVGSNGSGKSTIIKLLTSLYDATSGSITIDGEDIRNYRLADLRHATAALTQDHHLYPLSLRENIGLGNPAHVSNVEMIRAAAKQGGADGLISKLGDGFETVLEHPRGMQYGIDVSKGDGTLLGEALEKMTKEADVSGGERQRLVASRTFMRFTSGAVKLVCVDEPSSNMDPEAEWRLFKNFRLVREGKTMIFVTHRFAHLTKHADLILCMKEGSILESGTHEELMALDGEYCKMFEIQAKAFD